MTFDFCTELQTRTQELSRRLDGIGAPEGVVAYNPLDYAWSAHQRFLSLFHGPRRLLFVGMNPGPWGMVQTGVPFGNVEHARTIVELGGERAWLSLVGQPARALDDRPVRGFACSRDEVSGRRFWSGLAPLWSRPEDAEIKKVGANCPDAERFRNRLQRMLGEVFVMNLCPLAFFDATPMPTLGELPADADESDRSTRRAAPPNITPDKLKPKEWRDRLVGDASPCAAYFADLLRLFCPEVVVVMGAWVEKQVMRWAGSSVRVFRIPHPSPANPASNKGWAPLVQAALRDGGVVQ